MPELQEVEIVKQSLDQKICFKKIIKVIIKNRNLRFKIPVNFKNFLVDKKIIKIERFSKYLILNFSNGTFCLVHLGMSGTIHLVKNKKDINFTNTSFYNNPNLPKKHNHIKIFFKDIVFIYNDPRRFGFFRYVDNKQELKDRFSHLGPEPFFENFNLKYLLKYFLIKKKMLKVF